LLSKDNCEYQPSPDLLSQSIARCSTAEDANKKNLETLADSFLRFAMSMSLYHQHPFNEKLTLERNEPVSNKKLYQLAMRKEFKDYLSANEIKYGDKETSWFPSNYKVDEKDSDKCPKQKSKCKPLADTIESLIGAVLISTDYLTAIKFMKWLGLDIIPMDNQSKNRILFLFHH
jgi:dsRNA-specific ribonuclease